MNPSKNKNAPFKSLQKDGYSFSSKSLFYLSFLLAALSLGLYFQTFHFSFLNYDDEPYITRNLYVSGGLSLKGLTWAFTNLRTSDWQPLTWISHMIDCQLFGLNPGPHHLMNVLIHTFSAVLLFLLLSRMTKSVFLSFLTAALFALHPTRVESVAWVAERKDVLSGFAMMLTFWNYYRYVEIKNRRNYFLTLFVFALGLMAKPMLVSLPLLLLLIDYWPLKRREGLRRLILEKLPFIGLSLASCFAALLAVIIGGALADSELLPFSARVINAVVSYALYLKHIFWPFKLVFFYPYPIQGHSFAVFLSSGILISVLSYGAWQLRQKFPFIFVGWFWFLIMLLPVIGLIQAGEQAMANRYTYLPAIGIFITVIWTLHYWLDGNKSKKIIGTALGIWSVLLCCLITHAHLKHWKNSEALYLHAIQQSKNNYIAHLNLGIEYGRQGRPLKAEEQFLLSRQIHPGYYLANYNLALTRLHQNKYDEALLLLNRVLAVKPDHPRALFGIGYILKSRGLDSEAIQYFEKSLAKRPHAPMTHLQLYKLYQKKGASEKAEAHRQKALAKTPQTIAGYINVGDFLLKENKMEEALEYYHKALVIYPKSVIALFKIGGVYQKKNNFKEAKQYYERALAINPTYVPVLINLGTIEYQKGNIEKAREHFLKALEKKPESVRANYNLANLYASTKEYKRALFHYEQALKIKPDYAPAQMTLGILLHLLGDLNQAEVHLRETVRLTPKKSFAHYHLGNLLLQKGDVEAAAQSYEKALELNPKDKKSRERLQSIGR